MTDIYYCPRCLHVFTEGHHLCDASGPGATIIGKLSKDLPKVGDLFAGRYLLSELVARGGMGAVFKGTHNGQIFAIKVVKPACVASVRRFLKQAQAVSKIKHPSIVDISSWGISDSGHVYQVMEYLEGQTLAKTLAASGALGLPKALDLLITLASALDVVHGFDVLHLDLKPENIFLTKDGTVKLLDFLGAQDDLAPNFTEILGTPAYMSPEQALGDAVGSSADVYSLGVVFYEMLTGELPFAYERHSSKPSGVLDLPSMDIPFAARQKLLELLNLMTLDLPSKRPSAKEIAELAKSIDLQSTAYVANNMLG
ncbi:MAG TPA: serine/threonine-protein kinase, partial [Myxococcota bacterium]|nr:serine/threonine-protein kinase [Myxococcota bacterium]